MKTEREQGTKTDRSEARSDSSSMLRDGEKSAVGAMKGSVLGFKDPFGPAVEPSDWYANLKSGKGG